MIKSIRGNFSKLLHILLLVLICISGFYKIPYLAVDISQTLDIKRGFYFIILTGMATLVSWRRVKKNIIFWSFLVWILVNIASCAILSNTLYPAVLTRVVQGVFVYTLIVYLAQSFPAEKILILIRKFNPLPMFIIGCLVLGLAYKDELWRLNLYDGFGGNRVNFSIWIAQFTFLIIMYFLTFEAKESIHFKNEKIIWKIWSKPLIFVTPLLALQTIITSRLGLMASVMLVCCYGSLNFRSLKGLIISGAFCAGTVLFFNSFSPFLIASLNNNPSPPNLFRGILVQEFNTSHIDLFGWIDQFTALRLSIFVSGLSVLTPSIILFGLGVDNFKGLSSSGDYWAIHNVLLNSLGELGFLGFLSFSVILVMPFLSKSRNSLDFFIKFFCLLWTTIAMLQPDFLITQVSTSLAYFIAYVYLCRDRL